MESINAEPKDFTHVVFHMPNGKFPQKAGKALGFTKEQLDVGLVIKKIGNTYSGSSLLGFSRVLDQATPGDRILLTSYGSGAGSDSFAFTVTDKILERRDRAPTTDVYINRKENIDYGTYVRLRRKLKV